MYPPGHPHLSDSADRFVRRMTLLLETNESVSLGVARHRLVIDNVTTDANNALLRDLAHRLHRHRSRRYTSAEAPHWGRSRICSTP